MSTFNIRVGFLYLQDRLTGQQQPVQVQLSKHALTVLKKQTQPQHATTIRLERSQTEGLGFSLRGGADTQQGAPCVISKIFANSPANNAAGLNVGDALLKVNGKDVSKWSHSGVVNALQKAGKAVKLEVQQHPKAEDLNAGPGDWVEWLAIPLERACLSQYLVTLDTVHETAFEIYSMDRSVSCILDCNDKINLSGWFKAVRSVIESQNASCLVRTNRILPPKDRVIHMGWVSEFLPASHHWTAHVPKFLALRANSLELFTYAPQSTQDWLMPERSYNLSHIYAFLVQEEELVDDRAFCFQVQTGMGEDHYFSVETKDELTTWLTRIEKTTNSFIQLIGVKKIRCQWRRRETELQLHFHHGICLIDSLDGSVIWQHKFSNLKKSSDDGYKTVKLTFGNKKETHEIEVDNIVTLVYSIRAFLRAKIASLQPTTS